MENITWRGLSKGWLVKVSGCPQAPVIAAGEELCFWKLRPWTQLWVKLALHRLVVLWAPPRSLLLPTVVVVAVGPLVWIRTWAVLVHVSWSAYLRASWNAWLSTVWHAEMFPALQVGLRERHGAWMRRPGATGGRLAFHNVCLHALGWTWCGALGAALRGLPHSAHLGAFGSTRRAWHTLHHTGVVALREDRCGVLHSAGNIALLLILVPIISHCSGMEMNLKKPQSREER